MLIQVLTAPFAILRDALAFFAAGLPDRLLGRMTATMRFLTVAMAPVGSLVVALWRSASV
jgi:hypothetical protein